jgi:hypothetical protein
MKKDKKTEIDRIKQIMFGKKVDDQDEDEIEMEFSEEETTTDTSSSGAGASQGYPSVTKWESGATRGKANPIANNKWESGVTRGKANTLL